MRKTLLFVFALLFATAAMAQNRVMLFSESFDGSTMPEGWSVAGLGQSNWSISNSSNAAGSPNEVVLNWSPRFNGTTRLVTPAIDLTGRSSVVIGFKHALNNYSGSHPLSIATSSDNGATWNVGWTHNYGSSSRWEVFTEITTADMGHDNVKFCITFTGDSYNFNYWYFDDFAIYAIEELDGRILSVNVPEVSYGQETGDLTAEVNVGMTMMNFGRTQISSVEATYEIAGFEPVTQVFNTNISTLATNTLNFTEKKNLVPGVYDLTITINKVNGIEDDDSDNNTMQRPFYVSMASEEKIPMIEHFTASTCPYCPSVNNQMANLCNNNPGRYTYTKYQTNWPGNGDPYYTDEGGVRISYYEVSGVPSVFLDGTSASINQNSFDQEAAKPSCFDVAGSFSVDGNVVHVMADIAAYVDIPTCVYISVNEKETHNNVGSNGETVFYHVLMKMLPNAQGTAFNFVAGETQHIEFTQNMTGTHVEEMNDLEVAIWVQNYATKEIYNSHFAYEYTDLHPYPVENLTLTEADAPRGLLMATWNAPTNGNPIGYNVYVNNEMMAENITETSYSFEGAPEVLYVVGVVALYDNNKTSVKTVAKVSETMQDQGLITNNQNFSLNQNHPTAQLKATNANHSSQSPINILSIEEVNEDNVQYLTITNESLPYALAYDADFAFTIEPNALGDDKSVAQTTVVLTSDAGTLEYYIEVNGDVLNIIEVSAKAKIYPNPANDMVRIESEGNIESVMVYNMLGVLVETVSANSSTINVNLNGYNNGIYFFSIRHSDGTMNNQRVVVCH